MTIVVQARTAAGRVGSALWRATRRMNGWQVLLAVAIAWYVWNFTHTSLRIHYGLGTSAYDFGLYDQGTWLLSRFKAPFVTLMGRNLFGDHTSLIMLLVVPFYWVAPSAGTLFFLQSAALGGAAIPVYLLARRRLGSEPAAVALGVAFLLHPALTTTNLEEFHPDAFLPLLVGFAIYFAVYSRWIPFSVFVLLSLLVKEDVALVIVPLGIWVALRRDRVIGLVTIALGVGTLIFAMLLFETLSGRAVPNAWRIPFGGVIGFLIAVVKRPGEVFDYLLADGRPWYLWQLTVPYVWLFLLLPEIAAISALVVFSNTISTFGYQHLIGFHYTAVILPGLAMGTVYALARLRGRLKTLGVVAVLLMSLWAGYLWGRFPFGRDPGAYWTPSHEVAVAAQELIPLVPEDAIVSAHYAITAHLTHREKVYMFPNPFSTILYGVFTAVLDEGRRLPIADEVEYVFLKTTLGENEEAVWLSEMGAFEQVAANEHWVLWRRAESG